jgi:uncharacterized LabA/DUF88 family protein
MVREIVIHSDEDDRAGSSAARSANMLRAQSAQAKTATKATKTPKKKRVAVFIDGSNLYFKIRTLIPHKMDFIGYRYRDLAQSLLHNDERLVYLGYYVGAVRDTKGTKNHEKTQELLKNQQKLFEQLRYQKVDVVKGYLLERDGKYFEKGVDVRLAVDILTMAQGKKYDIGIVLSSDTDLIPAIQTAQGLKRQIMYIGFEHQPSLALIRYADRSRLLTRQEVTTFSTSGLAINRYDEA